VGYSAPRSPPARPEAPQPKSSWFDRVQGKFAGDWRNEDGYSSASTPSSDLDSEISELDTDEEIGALEEDERAAEAEQAKAAARERRLKRNSQRNNAESRRSSAKKSSKTGQNRPTPVVPPVSENKPKEQFTPVAPSEPKPPPRPANKKPRAARTVSSTPDMSVSSEGEDGGDEQSLRSRSPQQVKLSSRLAALSDPVQASVRPQHRRIVGSDALMQHAKVHRRILQPMKVLESVPERQKLQKMSAERPRSKPRDRGRQPGGAPRAIPLPQLEPKLPPRYEKVALGPARRRLDI